MKRCTRDNWRPEWPHDWHIEPTISYVVKVDSHTKFISTDYLQAIGYVINARAELRRQGKQDEGRVKMTMES